MKMPNFNYYKAFDVKFEKESGIDCGGLEREFWSLSMDQISQCNLLEGPEGEKWLSMNIVNVRNEDYKWLGTFIAMGIIHVGLGPNTFAPAFYQYLASGSLTKEQVSISDVCNYDHHELILTLQNTKTKKEWEDIVLANEQLDMVPPTINENDKKDIIQGIQNELYICAFIVLGFISFFFLFFRRYLLFCL